MGRKQRYFGFSISWEPFIQNGQIIFCMMVFKAIFSWNSNKITHFDWEIKPHRWPFLGRPFIQRIFQKPNNLFYNLKHVKIKLLLSVDSNISWFEPISLLNLSIFFNLICTSLNLFSSNSNWAFLLSLKLIELVFKQRRLVTNLLLFWLACLRNKCEQFEVNLRIFFILVNLIWKKKKTTIHASKI